MQWVHSEHRQVACERGEVHLSIPVRSQEEGSREAFIAVDHSVQRRLEAAIGPPATKHATRDRPSSRAESANIGYTMTCS